jgi:hypothetical protein
MIVNSAWAAAREQRLRQNRPMQGGFMTATVSSSSEDSLWRKATAAGIDRKMFLRLMTIGGSAAVGAALAQLPRGAAAQAPLRLFFKADYPEYFHSRGRGARRAVVRLHQLHHAGGTLLRA